MDELRVGFLDECDELLVEIEGGLSAFDAGEADAETVNLVFRAVHSIKGGAGSFSMRELANLAHAFENVMSDMRDGALSPAGPVLATLLRAGDVLSDLVAAARGGPPVAAKTLDALTTELSRHASAPAEEDEATYAPVAIALDDLGDLDLLGNPDGDDPPEVSAGTAPPAIVGRSSPPGEPIPAMPASRTWSVHFEPLPGLLSSGNEPLYLFRALNVLGAMRIECRPTGIPPLATLDPGELYLAWDIVLRPSAPDLTRSEIENVFDFVEGLCHLEVTPLEGSDAEMPVLDLPPVAPAEADKPAVPSPGDDAPAAAAAIPNANPALGTSVRVELDRIDALVDLVGEIVIAQSMLGQLMSEPGREADAVTCLDGLTTLTLEVQDSVMAIRALPIRPLLQRMGRVVREAAQTAGKEVRLETSGGDTRIDKTVIELLVDPLTHLIRNAIDHGIEPAARREAAGKPATGTVTITATQRSDRVLVEIVDDGGGIDREKVLARAREQDLVPNDETPSDAEIDRLLFTPGFSTADAVSSLSGRGVGMDVVASAIQRLSGSVTIESEPGKGTRIVISLPLTLAILDGMVVRCRGVRYVIPLASIVETRTAEDAPIETMVGGRAALRGADALLPLHDLADLLGLPGEAPAEGIILTMDAAEAGQFAIRADEIEAQRQVVVKGLASSVSDVADVSAATILGDGRVALILDSTGLERMIRRATMPDPDAIQRKPAA